MNIRPHQAPASPNGWGTYSFYMIEEVREAAWNVGFASSPSSCFPECWGLFILKGPKQKLQFCWVWKCLRTACVSSALDVLHRIGHPQLAGQHCPLLFKLHQGVSHTACEPCSLATKERTDKLYWRRDVKMSHYVTIWQTIKQLILKKLNSGHLFTLSL